MKLKSIILAVLVCSVTAWVTGCVSTVDGRMKAGVPFKKDKIEGRYERSVAQVFDASKVVLNRLGKVVSDDTVNKVVTAKVDTRTVFIKIEEIDPKISRLIVQVRTKAGGADIDMAAQVEKEIALHLQSNTR